MAEKSVVSIVRNATELLGAKLSEPPAVGLVLGSGLGSLIDLLKDKDTLSCAEIEGYPPSTVPGHEGALVSGRIGATPVLCAKGRIHGYEGYADSFLGLPARILIEAGCRTLVVTNAAGAVNRDFSPGDLMLITDHLNMTGRSPLTGPNLDSWGPRFPDLSRVWDAELRNIVRECADANEVRLQQGVYACMPGPQYETPAEVRMLRVLGADAVGMSTVPEAIIAAHRGIPTLGVSMVSNLGAGLSRKPLSHQEVLEEGQKAGGRLAGILEAAIPKLSR